MLLTRAPLYSTPEGVFRVRLACLRHAASVDSEPGSNSRLKVYPSHHYPLLVKYPNNDSSRESPFWPNRSPTRFGQLASSARLRMLFYHRTLTPKGLNLDTLYLVFKDLVRSFTLNDRPSCRKGLPSRNLHYKVRLQTCQAGGTVFLRFVLPPDKFSVKAIIGCSAKRGKRRKTKSYITTQSSIIRDGCIR